MGMNKGCFVIVPWVSEQERDLFLNEWGITSIPDWLVLQQDKYKAGCGATKNKGVQAAITAGAEVVVVLDGDCFPADEVRTLPELVDKHCEALQPQPVNLYVTVTSPPSRGTPYAKLDVTMPVAASMGFWSNIGDYCAVRQLAFDKTPMQYYPQTIFGKYFSLCGMNLAFKPADWLPWCNFIDVARFDDIWMGWLWQREAYRRGYCFNLNGPIIRHSRQSNVWKNLQVETRYLEENETLWQKIAQHPHCDYESLYGLLPI